MKYYTFIVHYTPWLFQASSSTVVNDNTTNAIKLYMNIYIYIYIYIYKYVFEPRGLQGGADGEEQPEGPGVPAGDPGGGGKGPLLMTSIHDINVCVHIYIIYLCLSLSLYICIYTYVYIYIYIYI